MNTAKLGYNKPSVTSLLAGYVDTMLKYCISVSSYYYIFTKLYCLLLPAIGHNSQKKNMFF